MENILNSTLNILNKLTKDGSLIKFISSSVVYVHSFIRQCHGGLGAGMGKALCIAIVSDLNK